MTQLFANAARTTLASGITDTATSLTVALGDAFPVANTGAAAIGPGADWFKVVLDDGTNIEVVYVRTHTSNSEAFGDVLRGQEGTTARAWDAGVVVGLRATAGDLASAASGEWSATAVQQNSQSAAYTLVLDDAGKHLLHPSADTTARTWTIPANASVAFPVGTVVTFINQNAAGAITIAITTDTMRLAGAGTTGSRTLAANGVATAIKLTATEWIISGVGLT